MKYVNRIMEVSLFGCVFFATFELAASFSFYLLELSAVALAISLLIYLLNTYGVNPFLWIRKAVDKLRLQSAVWIFLIAYIVWDIITLAYSPVFSVAISKYKVIVLMALICIGMTFYCTDMKRVNHILFACGLASVFVSIVSILNIYLKIYPIYYTKRLSLRVDYNMFAVTVFTGFITAFLLLVGKQMKARIKSIYIVALCSIIIPVVVLSGSRRTFLLLAPTLLLFWMFWFLVEKTNKEKRSVWWIFVMALMIIFFSLCIALGIRFALSNIGKEDVTGIITGAGTIETDALERYENMSSGSLLQKRSAIWFVAIDEIKTYNDNEVLFGKGNSYDIYFYDIVDDDRLNSLYNMEAIKGAMSAHNFLIADMMNGGVLKLVQGIMIWIFILKLMFSLLIEKEQNFDNGLFKIKNKWITCHGIIYSLVLGNTLINSLISNRFGFIYDRFFYIFLFLALIEANIKGVGAIQWKK